MDVKIVFLIDELEEKKKMKQPKDCVVLGQ